MNMRRICELEVADNIPADDELVVPIFKDHTNLAVRAIPIGTLADRIRDRVLAGGEVEMITIDNGLKFRRTEKLKERK